MKASDRGRNVKSKELFGCFDEFCIRMVYRVYDCSPTQRRDSMGATENAGFNATVPRADLGGDWYGSLFHVIIMRAT